VSFQTTIEIINNSQTEINLTTSRVFLFDAQDKLIQANSTGLTDLTFLAPMYPSVVHINTQTNVKTVFVCLSGTIGGDQTNVVSNGGTSNPQGGKSFSAKFTDTFPETITPANPVASSQRAKSLPQGLRTYEATCGS
jgi:hypothetical protein